MNKLWLSALTTATLVTGLSFGTAARADGWHHGRDHHGGRGHDRWEHCDDRRYYGPPPRGYGYYQPYRKIREVYYEPAPRYYRPAPVYYGYGGYSGSGVHGSISVGF